MVLEIVRTWDWTGSQGGESCMQSSSPWDWARLHCTALDWAGLDLVGLDHIYRIP